MKNSAIFALAGGLALSGAALPQKADTDGDGRLSLAEFQASRVAALLARDSDGDGRVSAAEWAAGGIRQRPNAARRDPAKAFARLDRSGDGYLDRGEIEGLLARRFAKSDADGDGFLTRQERGGRRSAADAVRD